MSLSGVQLAYLTCRSGLARSGAVRSAFSPDGVQGDSPGSAGGFYMWTPKAEPATVYDCVEAEPDAEEPAPEPEPTFGSVSGIISEGMAVGGINGWVILCNSDGSGQEGDAVQADGGGNFTIPDVPVGTYSAILYSENDEAYIIVTGVEVVEGVDTEVFGSFDTLGAHPSCPIA